MPRAQAQYQVAETQQCSNPRQASSRRLFGKSPRPRVRITTVMPPTTPRQIMAMAAPTSGSTHFTAASAPVMTI